MKHMKKILAIALVALTLMAVAMPAMAATHTWSQGTVNVRSGPGTNYTRIARFGANVALTYYETGYDQNGHQWLRVKGWGWNSADKYDYYTGWVDVDFVVGS